MRRFTVIFLALILIAFAGASTASVTELISLSGSTPGNGDSGLSGTSVSANGRFVAFASSAQNLSANDTNAKIDVFVRDRQASKVELISVSRTGVKSNGDSTHPCMSPDGRFVAFQTTASNLGGISTGSLSRIYIRDRNTGNTELVSVASGLPANADCTLPSISEDGNVVAFVSSASNLVSGNPSGVTQVFVRDRVANTTEIVSVGGNANSTSPSVSPDGNFVAFSSSATNLVQNDNNGKMDIFLYDRTLKTTKLVSIATNGAQGDGDSGDPSVSRDGLFVAFDTRALTFFTGTWIGSTQVFVRDIANSKTELVSVATSGFSSTAASVDPSISPDGRFVSFQSNATTLTNGYQLGFIQAFLRDRQTQTTEMISVSSSGTQGAQNSQSTSVSANGRYVSFASKAINLVIGYSGGFMQSYIRDRATGEASSYPSVHIQSPTPTYTASSSPVTLSGTVIDDLNLSSLKWSNSKGGSGNCTGANSWTASIPLQPGDNTVTITAVDSGGNTGTATIDITFADTTAPLIKITSPTMSQTYTTTARTIALSGTSSDNTLVSSGTWVSDRGGSGTCTGTTSWTTGSIPLTVGVTNFTVTAADSSGNKTSASLAVTCTDNVPPTIAITTPTAAPTCQTGAQTLTIGGTASDDVGVKTVAWMNNRGGNGTCIGTTSWSADVPLQSGVNILKVTASDAAGNTKSATLTVTYTDPNAPTITIVHPTSGPKCWTNASTLAIDGSATDNIAISSVAWIDDRGGSGLCTGTNSWNATIPLQLGANVITITATDADGHVGNLSLTTILYDTSAVTWTGTMMISMPIIPTGTDPQPIVQFRDNAFYAYRNITNDYAVYPDQDTFLNPVESTPGRGFWAKFSSTVVVPTGILGPQDQPVSIHLLPGWNLVGQPFINPVTWDFRKILVQAIGDIPRPLTDPARAMANFAWGWDVNAYAYYMVFDTNSMPDKVGQLAPWQAFWMYAYKDCDLVLPAP